MMKIYKINIVFVLSLLVIACNDSTKYPDGGYDYPKHVADKDTNFYYYPLKDIMSKNDSLRCTVAYIGSKQFNEPNISLRPLNNDEFRLSYGEAFGGYYILTLTKYKIQIKKEILSDTTSFDDNRLTEVEKKHFNIMAYYYPYDHLGKYMSKYIDSLKITNPEILKPEYFVQLIKKGTIYRSPQKTYTSTIVNMNKEDFNHLVNIINNSGYWKMPYDLKCENQPTDGFGFTLEANTKNRYNFVESGSCDDSTSEIAIFQKLVRKL